MLISVATEAASLEPAFAEPALSELAGVDALFDEPPFDEPSSHELEFDALAAPPFTVVVDSSLEAEPRPWKRAKANTPATIANERKIAQKRVQPFDLRIFLSAISSGVN